jgi:hypothetical protein
MPSKYCVFALVREAGSRRFVLFLVVSSSRSFKDVTNPGGLPHTQNFLTQDLRGYHMKLVKARSRMELESRFPGSSSPLTSIYVVHEYHNVRL